MILCMVNPLSHRVQNCTAILKCNGGVTGLDYGVNSLHVHVCNMRAMDTNTCSLREFRYQQIQGIWKIGGHSKNSWLHETNCISIATQWLSCVTINVTDCVYCIWCTRLHTAPSISIVQLVISFVVSIVCTRSIMFKNMQVILAKLQ